MTGRHEQNPEIVSPRAFQQLLERHVLIEGPDRIFINPNGILAIQEAIAQNSGIPGIIHALDNIPPGNDLKKGRHEVLEGVVIDFFDQGESSEPRLMGSVQVVNNFGQEIIFPVHIEATATIILDLRDIKASEGPTKRFLKELKQGKLRR